MDEKENVVVLTDKQVYLKPQTEVLPMLAEALLAGSPTGKPDDGNGGSGMPWEDGVTGKAEGMPFENN